MLLIYSLKKSRFTQYSLFGKRVLFHRRIFFYLIPDIFCFIDFIIIPLQNLLMALVFIQRKNLSNLKNFPYYKKCFGYLIHSAIIHFASPLYNSPSQQNWKLLCHSKMLSRFFPLRIKQFL